MRQELSPKQVARAIGVSESSLKRWCDQGILPTTRTAGGHRRLPLSGVLNFLQETGRTLVQPEVLGLPTSVGQGRFAKARALDEFTDAIVRGEPKVARQVVLDLYLQKQPLAKIFDEIFAQAFHKVGEQWECNTVDIYEERRGCEIAFQILHELKTIVPESPRGPVAVGASPEGDLYQIPGMMVELILREAGFSGRSLGTNIPLSSLRSAITSSKPDLFWLSVSHVADREQFLAEYDLLYQAAEEFSIPVIVGGQALQEGLRKQMRYTVFCDTMQHLVNYLHSQSDGSQFPKSDANYSSEESADVT